jgi:dihydrolipoamide dehydrogenase
VLFETREGDELQYDLIVIGGGPAGYHAAALAGKSGLKTLLIEKRFLGGVCLNEGCIPSKTILYSAKVLDHALNGIEYGVKAEKVSFDHQKVLARKNKVVRILMAGIRNKLKKNKVAIVEGTGRIMGSNPSGLEIKAGEEIYTSKYLLIATGSVPLFPPINGIKEAWEKGYLLTSREILDVEKVPSSLVIIGGGVIGLEMAAYFNTAGSKVTIIEMMDHIGGELDREIGEILLKNYKKKGVDFRLNSQVTAIKDGEVQFKNDDLTSSIKADSILLSVGRKPFLSGLGLDNIGIVNKNGQIKVDEYCRTNIPGVYAAGDVNGRSMLAHTAYKEAEVCISNILGGNERVNYNIIPSVIYTDPEVASVGETQESAEQKGIDYESVKISMRYSGRYLAEHEGGDGICKLIVDKRSQKLIGIQLISKYAAEIIYGAGLMIDREMKVDEIEKMIFPHPTVSEIIKEGMYQFNFED